MGNDKEYGWGYDPEALEHDLQWISRLMHGKKEITAQLAQEMYRRIKSENIIFLSSTGEEFWNKILKNTTKQQRQKIEEQILAQKRRRKYIRSLLNLNRKIATVIFAMVLLICIVFLNWNFFLDIRTNYQTKLLRDRIDTVAVQESTDGEKQETAAAERTVPKEETGASKNEDMETAEQEQPVILSKFVALHEENHDFSGWLSIEGTKINYPVMSREGDNNYYLDKNFNGQEDKNGLLILDYRSNVLESGQNSIIYGHNMRTGVMFGTLKNYKDRDFCMEHQTIRFDSLYHEGTYKVVAAMLSSVAYEDEEVFRYYDAVDISTEDRFEEFRQNIEANALYTTDESLAFGDSCLILSTCDNYVEDGRFVVIAKKIN